jgi:hypothetical protein
MNFNNNIEFITDLNQGKQENVTIYTGNDPGKKHLERFEKQFVKNTNFL